MPEYEAILDGPDLDEAGEVIRKATTGFSIKIDEGMAKELTKQYVKGKAAFALQIGKKGINITPQDRGNLIKAAFDIVNPIHDWNKSLGDHLYTFVHNQMDAGIPLSQIGINLEEEVMMVLKQPVVIKRPGKREYKATVEHYARLIKETVPQTIRNMGYSQEAQDSDLTDGWTSICADLPTSCDYCRDMAAQGVHSWDEEQPSYHPFCNCRVEAHLMEHDALIQSLKDSIDAERAAQEEETGYGENSFKPRMVGGEFDKSTKLWVINNFRYYIFGDKQFCAPNLLKIFEKQYPLP